MIDKGEQTPSGSVINNVGTVLIVIIKVVLEAHSPSSGVKVYMVVAVLSILGDHEPLIELVDVVGKGAIIAPEQIAGTGVKVGVIAGFTVIVKLAVFAHCPVAGVKV